MDRLSALFPRSPGWRRAVAAGLALTAGLGILAVVAAWGDGPRPDSPAPAPPPVVVVAIVAGLAGFVAGVAAGSWNRGAGRARLRQLTRRVVEAQEEERGRVARELHDGISQSLVGVRYGLDLARRRLAAGDPRATASLDKAADALGAAIHEVRRISRDLRPAMLDDLGLGPAIATLSEAFAARTGIAVAFQPTALRNRLDQAAKIAFYRIAQEALTNVERHSGASHVTMELRGHRDGVTLRIADDGRGMPADPARGGLGLRNMRERMQHLGGSLRVLSSTTGTVIEARVPLTHMLPPDEEAGPPPGQTAP